MLMTLAVTLGAAQPLPRHVASLTLSWTSWLAKLAMPMAMWALAKQGPQRSCKVHEPRAVHDSLSSFAAEEFLLAPTGRSAHNCRPQRAWHPCSK